MYNPKLLKSFREQEIDSSALSLEEYTLDKRSWDKVISILNSKSEDRTEKQIDFLYNLFSSMKFFSQLPVDVAKEAIKLFGYTKFDRHATVIDTLYLNRRFFIILTGSINLVRVGRDETIEDGKTVYQLRRGEAFGENNIHYVLKADARYLWITRDETELLMMDMEDYDRVVKDTYETELDNRVAFLRSLTVPIFNGFSTRQLYELAKCLEKKYFRHNQVIIKQHLQGNYMYFILEGECKVLKQIEWEEPITSTESKKMIKFLEVAVLKPKEYFGELALLNNTPRMASVYAATNMTTLALGKADFTRFLTTSVFEKMKEYSKGYPKECEIKELYMKKKKWEKYKRNLVNEILFAKGVKIPEPQYR